MNRRLVNDLLKRQLACLSSGRSLKPRNASFRQYHLLINPSSVCASKDVFNFTHFRLFSDKTPSEEEKEASGEGNEENESEQSSEEPSEIEKLEAEIKATKDQLLRSYAEQENIRRIAKTDVENARAFAITSFAKSLLDTSDNLTRALDAVPEEYREDKENNPVLATLYEGIKMTDDGLAKAFAKNGLTKFGAPGDKFDPNMHEALYEYPDEGKEAGTIGQVMKVGFSLKSRVIRPAEVGVIKSP